MDTLFRLVSFHHQQQEQDHHPDQHSFTTTTSTSFHHHHLEDDVEECCNTTPIFSSSNFMDEDLSSSSSSSKNHHHHQYPSYPSSTYTSTSTTPTHHPSFEPSPLPHVDPSSPTWSTDLLLDCARAVSSRDSSRAHRLLWTLNELSSPYGEPDQKLSSYFLHALFARLTSSGPRSLLALSSASDRSSSFDSTRRTSLLFQQSSPWSPFCHVSSNSSLLDHLENHPRIHVLDLGTTFCTQWPTFLESLATRSSEETPHLRLTSVVASPHPSTSVHRVMKEISARMERFARLMGVPFTFRYVHHSGDITTLDLASLCSTHPDEALAVNCINSLHAVPTRGGRETVLAAIRRLRPRVVTLVEEEADMCTDEDGDVEGEGFLRMFRESVRFFSAYFDSLEESFPKTSNERLALERAAGRAVMDLVACEPAQCAERRETGRAWSGRMREAGFEPVGLSEDGADDVRALLRRYREGWSLLQGADVYESSAGIYLAWKDQPVVWASTWKPTS